MRRSSLTTLCTALAIFWLLLPVACSLSPTIDAPGVSKLSNGPFAEISWSPEGSLILALKPAPPPNTESAVKWASYPSGDISTLTHPFGQYSNASWSPDGSRVAITVDFTRIEMLSPAHPTRSPLSSGEASAWFADGLRLLVYIGQLSGDASAERRLRTVSAAGDIQSEIPLTGIGGPSNDSDYAEYVSPLSLSRDDSRAAFGLFRIQAGGNDLEVYIADVASGAVQQILPDQRAGLPAWDPTEDRIAYIQYDESDYSGELVIAQADGSCLFKPPLPSEIRAFTWSPDANRIAFLYQGAIFVLDLEAAWQGAQGLSGC